VSEAKRKKVAFGALPFGTGNDLCTFMGIPWKPENAARTLIENTAVSPASIGKVKYHDTKFEVYFGNMFLFDVSFWYIFISKFSKYEGRNEMD